MIEDSTIDLRQVCEYFCLGLVTGRLKLTVKDSDQRLFARKSKFVIKATGVSWSVSETIEWIGSC